MNKISKLISISIFLAGPAHAMQNNKKPDQRLIETAKFSDKKQNTKLIAKTRNCTLLTDLGNELIRTAWRGEHKKLQELIADGAPVNHTSIIGETPLSSATKYGHHECLRTLIAAGASLNGIGNLLYCASYFGYPECVRILANHASALEKSDALMIAAINNRQTCLEILIAAGANVNHKDTYDNTALMIATINNHQTCLEMLIAAGANVDHKDTNETTALMQAASKGHQTCVQTLIAAGANVDRGDRHGDTALILAAANGHQTCVQTLIAKGASIDHVNRNGCSALKLAADGYCCDKPICELLIEAILLPKTLKNVAFAFLGCRKTGLLTAWKVPKEIILMIAKDIYPASRQANRPKAIEEIKKITCFEIKQQLLKSIPNAFEEIRKTKEAQDKERIFEIINGCEY